MFRFVLCNLCLAGALFAQQESCPDQVVETVDPVVTAQFPQTCGTNLSTTVGGVSIRTPTNVCPLLVLIRPGHATTTVRRGSGTLTRPVSTEPILALGYRCEESWLLGLIPIVVSSSCVGQTRNTVGVVTHYEQYTCSGEDIGDGDIGDGPRDGNPRTIHQP